MITQTPGDQPMPGTTENLSVRVSPKLREQLDQIATTLDRSRNWIINEAIKQYLEVQRRQIAIIEERLAEIESGEAVLIPHDEVVKRQEERLKTKLGHL